MGATFPTVCFSMGAMILASDPPAVSLNREVTVELRVQNPAATTESREVFEVTLRNTSKAPATVYRELKRGVVLEIFDSADNAVVPPMHYNEMCPPPPPKRSDWLELVPGQSVSALDPRSLKELGVTEIGDYTVRATYWHSVWKDAAGVHLSLARQPVVSRIAQFRVSSNPSDPCKAAASTLEMLACVEYRLQPEIDNLAKYLAECRRLTLPRLDEFQAFEIAQSAWERDSDARCWGDYEDDPPSPVMLSILTCKLALTRARVREVWRTCIRNRVSTLPEPPTLEFEH